MPWKECHVMDERLRFIARLFEAWTMTAYSSTGAKWRFATARPEPDFRYFSKRTVSRSVLNSIAIRIDHGRWAAV